MAGEGRRAVNWARIVALCASLEAILDEAEDDGLDSYITDPDTYMGEVYRGLPYLREYAEQREDRGEFEEVNQNMSSRPTIGRIVQYTLNAQDAAEINRRRVSRRPDATEGVQFHVGNTAHEGDIYPMMICRVWSTIGGGDGSSVNGQVFLDGNDVLWVTSRVEGVGDGNWRWPIIAEGERHGG